MFFAADSLVSSLSHLSSLPSLSSLVSLVSALSALSVSLSSLCLSLSLLRPSHRRETAAGAARDHLGDRGGRIVAESVAGQ